MASEKKPTKVSEKKLVEIIDQLLNSQPEEKKSPASEINNLSQETEKSCNDIENSNNKPKSSRLSVENFSTNQDLPGHTHLDTEQLPCGHVWVKDNEIYVEGLPGHNILPCIKPSKGINLFINGKLVKSKTAVSAHDYIHVDFRTQKKPFALTHWRLLTQCNI